MLGNWLKTSILMAGIMALFGVVGGLLGGTQGMILALAFGGAMNFFAYWNSDKMVLRLYNAQEADESTAPQFYRIVKELAGRAGLPMPRVYVINEGQTNAFATGRNTRRLRRPPASCAFCRRRNCAASRTSWRTSSTGIF